MQGLEILLHMLGGAGREFASRSAATQEHKNAMALELERLKMHRDVVRQEIVGREKVASMRGTSAKQIAGWDNTARVEVANINASVQHEVESMRQTGETERLGTRLGAEEQVTMWRLSLQKYIADSSLSVEQVKIAINYVTDGYKRDIEMRGLDINERLIDAQVRKLRAEAGVMAEMGTEEKAIMSRFYENYQNAMQEGDPADLAIISPAKAAYMEFVGLGTEDAQVGLDMLERSYKLATKESLKGTFGMSGGGIGGVGVKEGASSKEGRVPSQARGLLTYPLWEATNVLGLVGGVSGDYLGALGQLLLTGGSDDSWYKEKLKERLIRSSYMPPEGGWGTPDTMGAPAPVMGPPAPAVSPVDSMMALEPPGGYPQMNPLLGGPQRAPSPNDPAMIEELLRQLFGGGGGAI